MNKIWTVGMLIISMMACQVEDSHESDKGNSVLEQMGGEPGAQVGQEIDTLMDVGGYPLHFYMIKGKGIPIVFESGGGNDGTVWEGLLQPLFDSLGATLITYDRAGFGRSGIDTTRINLSNEVNDLEIGLQKMGYGKNAFLVSHSLGGSYALLYTARNKKKVKGSVFIDVTLPCFYTEEKVNEAIADMASYGIAEIKAQQIGFYYIFANYKNTNDLMRKTVYLSNIPSTIICADQPPNIAKTEAEILRWKACQKSFGNLPGHSYVLAENTSHHVFKDQPELVINEIVKLYRRVSLQ